MCSARLKDYDPAKRMRCATCAEQVDCWVTATSWSELLQYNREFVRNQRRSTAYSWYPVFENDGLTTELLRLHDYGCLIIDAQAGDHQIDQENPKASPPGPWYEIKQRAYIRFLLPTEHRRIEAFAFGELETHLATTPAIEMACYYEYAEYIPGQTIPNTRIRFATPMLPKDGKQKAAAEFPRYKNFYTTFEADLPETAGRATSKHRTAYHKDDLQWKSWKKCANNQLAVIAETDIPCFSQGKRGFGVELPVSQAMKPVIVTVAWREWPPEHVGKSLATVVEDTMLMAGMKPVFKEEDELKSEEAKGWHKSGGREHEHINTDDRQRRYGTLLLTRLMCESEEVAASFRR
ncbi:hypothetical protein P171DRAFT_475936 [Karstenula rhodostoma CBS 690.94]|uniref:Uncharacterized protein n=1 Tax=Karstenula rhodostoma CBS 690.94 TaxID=1392251 RepID=A0A9P4P8R3_9PLEO|nr:hypothetical protein P171DRAFT_475936 [Karstenula rhodostoma CBS 690.94]